MGLPKIGASIVLDSEKEFKQAVADCNKNLNLLKSTLKLVSTQYATNANSLEALQKKQEVYEKQQTATKQKVEELKKAHDNAKTSQDKIGTGLNELRERLQKATEKMEEMKKSSSTSTDELEKQQKEIDDLSKAIQKGEDNYRKAGNRIDEWQKQINNAEAEEIKLSNAIDDNNKYLDEARRSTDKCAKSIDEFGNAIEDSSNKTSVFGDVLKANLVSTVIIEGVKKIADVVGDMGKSVITVGSSFESAMSLVASTMGMTTEEINNGSKAYDKLKEAAEKSGAETKYTATESAEALNYLALAGYNVDKAVETLPKTLTLAMDGAMDLATATDMVTDSMASLDLQTSEVDSFIDKMAKTAQKSNTSVAQLGEAILTVGGTAKVLRGGVTELNTELGILANVGIKGAEGGTHLRNIILAMTPTTDAAAAAFENLKVKAYDTDGNLRNLNNVFLDLKNAMSGMTEEEKQKTLLDIFNKTDLAAVNAMLKDAGDNFNNLASQIENSEGAANEMAKTMNDNLKGRMAELGSVIEAVGITVYDKFEGTFKHSVESATESIGDLNEELKRGELGESFDELAESIEGATEDVIEFAIDALPVAIDGLTWMIKNADVVTTGIKGIATAMLFNKTASLVVNLATDAYKAYKTATESATVAQAALNIVQSANPIGLITAGIVGLTAVMVTMKIATKDTANETEILANSMKDLAEKNKDFNNEVNDSITSMRNNKQEIQYQYGVTQELADKLYFLSDRYNGSNKQIATMQMYVDQLNEAIPELNLAFDEQTGKLNKTNEETNKLIDSYIKLSLVEAAKEDMAKIAKERYEAEKKLAEIIDKRNEIETKLSEVQKKYADNNKNAVQMYGDNMDALTSDNIKLVSQIDTLKESMNEADSQIEATTDTINTLTGEYEKAYTYTQDHSVGESMTNAAGEIQEAVDTTNSALEILKEQYEETYIEALDSISSQVSLFDELSLKSDLSLSQMIENMQKQAESWEEWKDNLIRAQDLVKEGMLDQGVLGAIQDMGVQGAAYLDQIVSASEADMAKINESFKSITEGKEAVAGLMAEMETGFNATMDNMVNKAQEIPPIMKTKGEQMVEGLKKGIKDSELDLLLTAGVTFTKVNEKAMEKFDIHSPSKLYHKYGGYITEGLANGIASKKSKVTDDMLQVANAVINTAESKLTTSVFSDMGSNIAQGLANGISSGISTVINAATALAGSAIEAAKNKLDIHSPSRVFKKIGEYTGEGYKIGAVESFNDAINQVNSVIDAGINDVNTTMKINSSISTNTSSSLPGIEDLIDKIVIEVVNYVTVGGEEIADVVSNSVIKNISKQQSNRARSEGYAW